MAPEWLFRPAFHAVGALLLAGRLAHGWCFLFTARNVPARVAGMVMTIAAVAIGGGASLWSGLVA